MKNKLILLTGVLFYCFTGYSQAIKYGFNPTAGKYVKVNGIRLYYESYGTGQPLVLLHGNNSSISDFVNQIPAFSKHYRVIAIDSRGQGNSTNDYNRQITYSLMASDVAGLLDSLRLDSVFVYGHSDGGIIGLELAYAYPGKVRKLVAGSPNYAHDSSAIYARVLRNIRQVRYRDVNPGNKTLFYKTSPDRKHDSITFEQIKALLLNYPNFTPEQLGSIKTPTLILMGDHDIIKRKHLERLCDLLPNGQLCIVPNTTHNYRVENYQGVNHVILEFFSNGMKNNGKFWILR